VIYRFADGNTTEAVVIRKDEIPKIFFDILVRNDQGS
jgi:hypothetical protein